MTEHLRIGRRDVKVTHPDKVLFARAKLTKLDLARHYERVAPVMLPSAGESTKPNGRAEAGPSPSDT